MYIHVMSMYTIIYIYIYLYICIYMIVSDIFCIAALWLILSRLFQVETPLLLRFTA